MWLERFIIVVTSLQTDFLPSAWRTYVPTVWDWATFIGTIGMFVTLFLAFVRLLPMMSIFEMKKILAQPAQAIRGANDDGTTLRDTGRV
jgi:molybdopterin-containing oxidoreductase family membrane subunit